MDDADAGVARGAVFAKKKKKIKQLKKEVKKAMNVFIYCIKFFLENKIKKLVKNFMVPSRESATSPSLRSL